jgi:aminoglycoside N3'-acetyltransferase
VIDLSQFCDLLRQEFGERFKRAGITDDQTIPKDLDLISAGILDSFDLLNLATVLETGHGLAMDFSVFAEGFDATAQGLYLSLTPLDGGLEAPPLSDDKSGAVIDALRQAGVTENDILLVHSSTATMGLDQAACERLYDGIRGLVGAGGTILAPAANSQAFLDGKYDAQLTPVQSDLGMLSELVRQQPDSRRSMNPFDAVVAVGPAAAEICDGTEPECYGEQSPWKRALGRGVKILLLGVDFYVASIVHVAERDCRVPYRDWKDFPGSLVSNGARTDFTVRLYATAMGTKRYYQRILEIADVRDAVSFLDIPGGGMIVPLDVVYDACRRTLAATPYAFVDRDA